LFRSALPVRYSEGFNPHPLLEFANPLGVGISSSGEYLDFELTKDLDPKDVEDAVKGALTTGFEFVRLTVLNDRVQGVKKASAMSLVDRADYLLYIEDIEKSLKDEVLSAFREYISADSIMISAPTKKTERVFDLKENLFGFGTSLGEFLSVTGSDPEDEKCNLEEEENGLYLYLRLSSGSAMNIRPEIVLDSFTETKAPGVKTSDFAMHRIEMFHNTETGAVPLWAVK
ncbi:MAG: DUF2344 domain-containing protein, partial [Lachnospiraceae bacterium]|nr:DUF2344 domain-containing protein [Lachnospiraceae bacterium]